MEAKKKRRSNLQREKVLKQPFAPVQGLGFHRFGSQAQVPVSNPSKLSNLELMRHPRMFQASLGLMNKLSSNELSAGEVLNRMGFDAPKLREGNEELSNSDKSLTDSPQRISKQQKGDEPDENSPCEKSTVACNVQNENIHQEEGESLIRELLDRQTKNPSLPGPVDDLDHEEVDNLNTKAKCYRRTIPGYESKSKAYRKHCRRISKMTVEKMEEHYTAIRPKLRDIFEGKVVNERTNYYLQGSLGIKFLQDMSVSIPFEHSQTTIIINMLLEYFVPEAVQRPTWSNYISYVLLPEALIHIYARANKISFEQSEKEMRFQGCYEDD